MPEIKEVSINAGGNPWEQKPSKRGRSSKVRDDSKILPAGTRVCFNMLAIQHDLEQWNDPDTFIPDRFKAVGQFTLTP